MTGGILVLVGLAILVAGPPGVEVIPLPAGSWLADLAREADYVDTFRMRVAPDEFPDVASLDALAFQKGELVERNAHEVVYRGNAPGLRFWVRYAVDPGGPSVEMSTVVQYLDSKGRLYFAFVRPIHRIGVPWMFRRQVNRARRVIREQSGVISDT